MGVGKREFPVGGKLENRGFLKGALETCEIPSLAQMQLHQINR